MTMIKANEKLSKLILITVLILVAARPGWSENAVGHGAAVLTLEKNNVQYEVIPFDRLFFKYHPPMEIENPDGTVTPKADKPMPIPAAIKALNGKKVAIKGFVTPLENDGKNVKTFLLVDQLVTCLFCQGLGMDQWIMTEVVDPKGIRLNDDQYDEALTVYGTLEVGEEMQNGEVTSIYRMKADGVEVPKKKFLNIF